MRKNALPPTMQDVATLARVSPMTVSRALKPNTSVNINTRQRIKEAAEQLGYVLNANAAQFSTHKTGFVAVIIPSINNANFAETVTTLTQSLKVKNLQVLLGYTNYSINEEERLVEQLLQRRPEAIVLTGGAHTARCRKLLEKASIPVIEIWDTPPKPIDQYVGFSNAQAAQLMVNHFYDLGLTKLGFIGGDTTRDTRGLDRRKGFIARLEELGLETHRMVSAGIAPITVEDGVDSIKRLLTQWPDVEAVMCVSDLVAFGALSYCIRHKINVPEDLAIAGFGAYDISKVSNPTITTIDMGAAKIGHATASMIIDQLFTLKDVKPFICNPQLLVRESTQK